MSDQSAARELLMDASGAVVTMLRSKGWVAGPQGRGRLRLAGGPIDSNALFVTDLMGVAGGIAAETRIPVQLPPARRMDGLLLCSAMTANDGIVSIDPDHVPVVHTRLSLIEPQDHAALLIANAILRQRQLARAVTPAFLALAYGRPLSAVAEGCGIGQQLPFASEPRPPARLDLSRTPPPSAEALAQARQLPVPEAEMMAIARGQTLNENQPHDAQPCAGPLIFHADGVAECYGCTDPLRYIHAGGCTASCRPGRKLGTGHLCQRCDAPLGSG
jgi:hypothetical protein